MLASYTIYILLFDRLFCHFFLLFIERADFLFSKYRTCSPSSSARRITINPKTPARPLCPCTILLPMRIIRRIQHHVLSPKRLVQRPHSRLHIPLPRHRLPIRASTRRPPALRHNRHLSPRRCGNLAHPVQHPRARATGRYGPVEVRVTVNGAVVARLAEGDVVLHGDHGVDRHHGAHIARAA